MTSYSVTSSACCSFFFSSRRRHTRYIGDWSSDVCSSDLEALDLAGGVIRRVVEIEDSRRDAVVAELVHHVRADRSEERRVGKEGRSRWLLACEKEKSTTKPGMTSRRTGVETETAVS